MHEQEDGGRGPGLVVDRPAPPSDNSGSDGASDSDSGSGSGGGLEHSMPVQGSTAAGSAAPPGGSPTAAAAAPAVAATAPHTSSAAQRAAIQAARNELGLTGPGKHCLAPTWLHAAAACTVVDRRVVNGRASC